MPYELTQPPFSISLREMSKAELRRYADWFCEAIPGRIDQLRNAVLETRGYESWDADATPGSLNTLGKWFAAQVSVRPRSDEEKERIVDKLRFPIEVPGEELTTNTLSLAMDIGMYLSQVFLKSHPYLKWDQPLGSKRFIDYGQPVLTPFRPGSFNPVRMVVTLAYGLVSHRETADGLRELYETWSGLAK